LFLLRLVLRNAFRHRLRTLLTIAGLAIVPPPMPAREGCGEPFDVAVDVGDRHDLVSRVEREEVPAARSPRSTPRRPLRWRISPAQTHPPPPPANGWLAFSTEYHPLRVG